MRLDREGLRLFLIKTVDGNHGHRIQPRLQDQLAGKLAFITDEDRLVVDGDARTLIGLAFYDDVTGLPGRAAGRTEDDETRRTGEGLEFAIQIQERSSHQETHHRYHH